MKSDIPSQNNHNAEIPKDPVVIPRTSSASLDINASVSNGTLCVFIGRPERDTTLTEYEKHAYHTIIEILSSSDSIDTSKLRLEKRSDSYTSLLYGQYNDFLRFKLSDKTKWISIRMPLDEIERNIDNPLFAAQKNKKQLHWKCKLERLDDIEKCKDLIIKSCIEF